MEKREKRLWHVSGKPAEGSLYGRQLVFTHIPKAAGTTLDWIMAGVAWHRSEEIFRAYGTLYGQFLGSKKADATAILLATPPETLATARFLDGHIPTSAWDEIAIDKEAAFITILRDPIERMISHYRFGLERGGWKADVPLSELVEEGLLTDNLQVRQISGCRDPSEPCTEAMLEVAMQTLVERYAVVGFADSFNAMLGTLIMLCGWPDIIYSQYQTGTFQLDGDRISALREECGLFNRFDQLLVDAVKTDGAVRVGPVGREASPPIDDSVLIVAGELKDENGDFPTIPKAGLDDFNAWAHRENVRVTKA